MDGLDMERNRAGALITHSWHKRRDATGSRVASSERCLPSNATAVVLTAA